MLASEQNEGSGALGYGSDLAEVRKLTELALPPQLEDAGSRGGADARDAEKLFMAGAVHLHGEALRMGLRPDQLGVGLIGQIARIIEDQVLEGEAILTEEEITLVEAMLA
jgi:hypothetical protein